MAEHTKEFVGVAKSQPSDTQGLRHNARVAKDTFASNVWRVYGFLIKSRLGNILHSFTDHKLLAYDPGHDTNSSYCLFMPSSRRNDD